MEDLLVLLTFVFAIPLFIWFKKTHIVFTTNWFWGNASIFGSCLVAGWIIATLLLTVLRKVVPVVLNIAVTILLILCCLVVLYGFIILIYGYIHRKEVHSPDKPQRSGFCGQLDHYTEKLWESKWFAYCIYTIVIIGLIAVLFILVGDIANGRHNDAFEQSSASASDEASQTNFESSNTNVEPLDLSFFSGAWHIGDNMTCTISSNGYSDLHWTVTITKTDANTAEQHVLGPFPFEPVDATHANATYPTDNFGHYGIIELVASPNHSPAHLIITAHDMDSEPASIFSFATDSALT